MSFRNLEQDLAVEKGKEEADLKALFIKSPYLLGLVEKIQSWTEFERVELMLMGKTEQAKGLENTMTKLKGFATQKKVTHADREP